MQTVHVGIDPGLEGALAVLEDGELEFHDTSVYTNGTKRHIDAAKCAALLRDIKDGCQFSQEESKIRQDTGKLPVSFKRLMVTIERVGAMPKQGVTSVFTFGYGFGVWIGILAALEIPYQLVTPQSWKKLLMPGEPKEKDASRVVARRLWPSQTEEALSRKKDHGRADAALLAEYGRRTGAYQSFQ